MSSGLDFFSHMRSKLRQSRSSVQLSNTHTSRPQTVYWENTPIEYRPVRNAGEPSAQLLSQPLQEIGRPRTTSPVPTTRPKLWIDTSGTLYNKTSQTYRRKSEQVVQTPWPTTNTVTNAQPQEQPKYISVEIAVALPPEYLDPPPPYVPYVPPQQQPERDENYAIDAPATQQVPPIRPYEPRRYVPYGPGTTVKHSTSNTGQGLVEVPAIAPPPSPTPVSPINTVDLQYLALRRSKGVVTIDSLLDHPLLQRPG